MIQLCRLIAHHQGAVHTSHTYTHTLLLTHAWEEGCLPSVTWLLGKCLCKCHTLRKRLRSRAHRIISHQGIARSHMEEALSLGIHSLEWLGWGGRVCTGQAPWGAQLRHMES